MITDEEIAAFQLDDDQLEEDVIHYFGRQPNDVFLRSPTPWGDLYKTYNWPQVQTCVHAESAEILDVTSKPVALKTQAFTNNSHAPATFNVAITESVTDKTSSNWSTGGGLTLGQTIKYEFGFLGIGGGGESSWSYSKSWGKGGQESKSVTLGSSSGVSTTLLSGQGVVVKLSASRGTMKIRVRYRTHLIGSTAVNYNPTYKGHHFYALGIRNVMSADDIYSTEDIDIDYYSSSKIEVKDEATGATKFSFNQ